MKKYLLTILFLSFIKFGNSQQVIFANDYNGSILAIGNYTSFHVCDTTYNGNYLMVGGGASLIGSSYAYAITDQSGNPLWEKDSSIYDSFGNHEANFYDGMKTYDNGFIFCGSLTNYSLSSDNAIFILKTDSGGNEIWRKSVSQFQLGAAESIYQSYDSSYYFIGNIRDSISNNYNQYLLKLSSSGDSLFFKIYPYGGAGNNLFNIDDKFFMCGVSNYLDSATQQMLLRYSLISIDTMGNFLSSYIIKDSLYRFSVHSFFKTSDNNILVLYSIADSTQQGMVQLMKIDTAANIIWRNTISNHAFSANTACELPNGNIIVAYGNFQVEERNSNGDTIWTRNFEDTIHNGSAIVEVSRVFPLDNSTFLISGSVNYSAPGGSGPYLMKVSNSATNGIYNPQISNSFLLFPNPAKNSFTASFGSEMSDVHIEIYNMVGVQVYSESFVRTQTINDKLPSGVYFVKVSDGRKQAVEKLIIQ